MDDSSSEAASTAGTYSLRFLQLATSNKLLAQLSRHSLETLLSTAAVVDIESDQHLLLQGAPSDAAYLLVDGEVEVLIENPYGSVHLAQLSAGAVVGEVGIFTDLPRNASVIARRPTRALRFSREDVLNAANDSPRFLRSIMSALGKSLVTYYNAIGFFANALSAIEHRNFDLRLLDDLMFPTSDLTNFSQTFRRIAEQIILRKAFHRDMDSAAAIQRAFLPDPRLVSSHASNLEIFAEMRPAKEVGGDLYDFFFVEDDKLAITIGDVVGKGIPAALFMAVTQTVIRLVLRHGGHLSEQIKSANNLLESYNKETMFVTLFCCVIDLATGIMTYCNCGHNAPLLLRKGQNIFERLKLTGMPVALDSGVNFTTREINLMSGDCLVLFTDGITEAMNSAHELYGDARLEEAVRSARALPATDLVRHIIAAATEFAGDAPQSDDMTCLALAYKEQFSVSNNDS